MYISLNQLAHFLVSQLADYCTVHTKWWIYYYIRQFSYPQHRPPGFFDTEEEVTGATEAIRGLPRLGGTADSGATRPR